MAASSVFPPQPHPLHLGGGLDFLLKYIHISGSWSSSLWALAACFTVPCRLAMWRMIALGFYKLCLALVPVSSTLFPSRHSRQRWRRPDASNQDRTNMTQDASARVGIKASRSLSSYPRFVLLPCVL